MYPLCQNLARLGLIAVMIALLITPPAWAEPTTIALLTAKEVPVWGELPQFALTDQEGNQLRRSDLLGTVWVASFIFTHCPDVCPLIASRMASLRDSLAAKKLLGTQVRLVSFTVDPERDTPLILHNYAARFGANSPQQWAFLSGQPQELSNLISQGFRLAVTKMALSPTGDRQSAHLPNYNIVHSQRLALVDCSGQLRGLYPALEPATPNLLMADLRIVLQESGCNHSNGIRNPANSQGIEQEVF